MVAKETTKALVIDLEKVNKAMQGNLLTEAQKEIPSINKPHNATPIKKDENEPQRRK